MDDLKNQRDGSGFFLQLRVLLWKNFTIKRRHPIVFLLEIIIPLTLFIIFMLIRQNKQAIPISTSHYSPMPLPSAGLIPMLQSFCHSDGEQSVYDANNTRLTKILDEFQQFLSGMDSFLFEYDSDALQRFVNISEENSLNNHLDNIQSNPGLLTFPFHVWYTYVYGQDLSIHAKQLTFVTLPLTFVSMFRFRNWFPHQASFAALLTVQVVYLQRNSSALFEGPFRWKSHNGVHESPAINHSQSRSVDSNKHEQKKPPDDSLPELLLETKQFQKLSDFMEVAKTLLPNEFDNLPSGSYCEFDSESHSFPSHKHKKVISSVEDRFVELMKLWKILQPTLCNHDASAATKLNVTETDKTDEDDLLSSSQKRHLLILTRLLYHNPKILFAPNNSAAYSIIKKVNVSFSVLDNINNYAKQWLKISADIRKSFVVQMVIQQEHLTKLLDNMDRLACSWLTLTSGINVNVFMGFSTETQLEDYFLSKQFHENVTVVAGLVFENLNSSNTTLPPHIRYKIRQNATLNPPTNQVRSPFWFPSPGSNNLDYYYYGFVWIQDLIERAIISLQSEQDVMEPGAFLKRMPYPCWLFDHFIWLIQQDLPLCLLLSWIYSVATLVQRIVYEKEKGLKEIMKMMGLSNTVHWSAWFITAFIQMTLTVVALTLILYYGNILSRSDPWLTFVFLELFAVSSITLSFLISCLYSRAKFAAACAGILYFLTFVPYIYIEIQESFSQVSVPARVKTGASIFSTSALSLGAKYFLFYELDGVGVQWNNLHASPIEHDSFNMRTVLIMMAVDTILYALLTWYMENVYPGQFGIPKPWYFPCMLSYWKSGDAGGSYTCSVKRLFGIREKKRQRRLIDGLEDDDPLIGTDEIDSCEYKEDDESNVSIGVKIVNLTKIYTPGTNPALNKLSMNLYRNQITSFLGHNGAGKTTTISLLTGMFPSTSGDAIINGLSVCTDMDKIRQSLGFCPQHNMLFESLTVEDHLWFYARLKGMKPAFIKEETARILKDLGLTAKRHVMPDCLSGGMQRKISVAMAFVGGSKTVILDEPTAGVDPYSRRAIWKLLNKYKHGRTILLSTHHMDEAEVLGDRIAIIANGELKCIGSPTYLKSQLGDGVKIHIVKEPTEDIDIQNQETEIICAIQAIVPAATVVMATSQEMSILVPVMGRDKTVMAEICEALGEQNVASFGITDGGLEDVFIRITEEDLKNDQTNSDTQSTYTYDSTYDSNDLYLQNFGEQNSQDDCQLIDIGQSPHCQTDAFQAYNSTWKHLRHFKALLAKRLCYSLRNRKAVISQIILPAIFVCISMTIALSAPKVTDPLPMTMAPSQYFNLTQPKGNFIPYSVKPSNRSQNRICASADRIARTFQLPSGIGATCLLKSAHNSEYDIDKISHLNVSAKSFELFAKYFNDKCSGVFTPGVHEQIFVPATSVKSNNRTNEKSKAPLPQQLGYCPICQCKSDNTGFECARDGYKDPPSQLLVTRDILQNITDVDEENFYLYTTDRYRLHRYGGFTFGTQLKYIPEQFGNDRLTSSFAVKDTAQVWFNKKGYHSIPVYVNTLNNAILRANLPKSKGHPSAYGITLVNHPMKKTNTMADIENMGRTDMLIAIFVIIAMAFVQASFVVFLVHERSVKAKHLQYLSGLNPLVYWISNYLWDMCNYLIPAVCIVVILLAFHIPAYVAKGNFEAVVALFLLYGWSITPMMYPASFLFKESSVAYVALIVFNLFTGITCVVASFILEQFSYDKHLSDVHHILKSVFLVFPNYCLGNGLMEIALNQYKNEFYSHAGLYEQLRSPLEWDITGRRLVVMSCSGAVFFIITILCEYRFFIKCRGNSVRDQSQTVEDDDVTAERERTLNCSKGDNLLRLKNLRKVYKSKKRQDVVAVDSLTFSMPVGECFGLLGVNGAGKTTTFKMLTGDVEPSSGDAKLNNSSLVEDLHNVQQKLGYCPQFDALFDELTPSEHLLLYARLRGISPKMEKKVVQEAISQLALQKYANQPAGTLSGGNKRKLATAISLIGEPPLILMDEPTTGMDPYSRRFLWDTIKSLVKEGKSVLFTSHSMEECEYLCSRLAIMVNGQLKCIGSKQHLKSKFGDGYTLKILLDSMYHITGDITDDVTGGVCSDIINDIINHVTSEINGCTFTDRSHKTLIFDVKVDFTQLGQIYRSLDSICQLYNIRDYTFSQNTLDSVFVKFAKLQTGVDKEDSDANHSDNIDTDIELLDDVTTTRRDIDDDDDDQLISLSPGISRLEIIC